jgi:hypothetical protein
MSDWVFYTLFLLVIAFVIFNGILMLVAPAKHRRFLFWFGRASSWSQPVRQEPGRGPEIERRLAGFLMAVVGIYIAWGVMLNAAVGKKKQDVPSVVDAAATLKPVALSGEGVIVGAAFSPDSSRLAILRNVAGSGSSGLRHVLQIMTLKSGQELARADAFGTEAATLASNAHFIAYSPDAHYLLLATKGSDVLSILDATAFNQ